MSEPDPITTALLTAIRHSTEPMVLTDPALPDHPMIAVNDAFCTITGYARAETEGRNCRFLQGEGTDRNTTARIRHSIAEERGCIEWVLNYRKDGSKFWNLLFLSPVFARDGRLLHYFGNQRDITEGPPASLPDYTLGRADMPAHGEQEFHALLLSMLEESQDHSANARSLERLVEAARQIDRVSTNLQPASWQPPSA